MTEFAFGLPSTCALSCMLCPLTRASSGMTCDGAEAMPVISTPVDTRVVVSFTAAFLRLTVSVAVRVTVPSLAFGSRLTYSVPSPLSVYVPNAPLVSLEVQTIFPSAPAGNTEATSVSSVSALRFISFAVTAAPFSSVTATPAAAGTTVITCHASATEPSAAEAITVTSCASVTFFAVTVAVLFFPALTEAYSSSPAARLQTIPVLVRFSGTNVAVTVPLCPVRSLSAPVTESDASTISRVKSVYTPLPSHASARTTIVPAVLPAVRMPVS